MLAVTFIFNFFFYANYTVFFLCFRFPTTTQFLVFVPSAGFSVFSEGIVVCIIKENIRCLVVVRKAKPDGGNWRSNM